MISTTDGRSICKAIRARWWRYSIASAYTIDEKGDVRAHAIYSGAQQVRYSLCITRCFPSRVTRTRRAHTSARQRGTPSASASMCLPRSAFEKALIRVLEGNLPAETPDGIMAPHEKKRTVSTTKLLTQKARIITETWGLQSVEKISKG